MVNSTITVAAQATDEFGEVIDNAAITYSLASSYTGVSINSSTGVVTIASDAPEGSVQLTATYNGLTCSTTLNIDRVYSVLFISTTIDKSYIVSLGASNIQSFTGTTYTLKYDPAVLQISDLCAFTYAIEASTGAISGTNKHNQLFKNRRTGTVYNR
jgi:hypothetical protein